MNNILDNSYRVAETLWFNQFGNVKNFRQAWMDYNEARISNEPLYTYNLVKTASGKWSVITYKIINEIHAELVDQSEPTRREDAINILTSKLKITKEDIQYI